LPTGARLYVENAEPFAIAPDALVSNPDAAGFDGGRLVVSISLNGEAGDRLAIANQGSGAGQIGVSGASVTFGGQVIGTWTGGASGTSGTSGTSGASGSAPLVVTFNAKVSSGAVQAVARSITFETVSENPSALARSVDFVVENSGGLASKGASVAVSVQPVDDAPVMQTATLHLRFGETVTLGTANVLGSDVDSASASLRFIVSGVTNGWFEASGQPGTAISSFGLNELQSGGVRFVHSGKGMAPTFQVAISDGALSSKPMLAAVTFEGPLNPGGGGGSGGGSNSGGGSGSGGSGSGGTDSGGGGGTDVKPVSPVRPTPATKPAEKPAVQPAVSGVAETPLFNPLVESPSSGVRGNGLDQVLSASMQMPAIEPSATAVARVTLIDSERQTAILISEGLNNGDFDLRLVSVTQVAAPTREAAPQAIEVEPAPAEQVAPEVVVNEITVSVAEAVGLSLTVGVVWWALRLGGLLASAMVSIPAWRQIDLLPILDDQRDGDWDADDDRDDGSEDQEAEEAFAATTSGREP
jgi:hypothetical protein